MQGTTIIKNKRVKPYKPILVVGLPGIGYVGRLIALHLIKEMKAVKFATLYSDQFPYEVIMTKKGTARIVNNRFYLIKRKKPKSDIIVLTGDVQPLSSEGQYLVNTKILEFFKELGGTFVYTLGGYNSGTIGIDNPKVFGSATNTKVIEKLRDTGVIFGKTRGTIVGSAGLIIAFAKIEKLDGVCLMGESSFLNVDAAAAKSVLKILAKNLDLDINTSHLDKMINKTAKVIREIREQQRNKNFGAQSPPTIPSYIR